VVAQSKEFVALVFGQGQGAAAQGWLPNQGAWMTTAANCNRFTDFESRNS
jgi:hypothetical protein